MIADLTFAVADHVFCGEVDDHTARTAVQLSDSGRLIC
ncbi:hypothetical protein FHU33_1800 [Blastococcus colisei]|uniref:Uncharacterized protein n=1 Tax=Blastococcus colisei TaxID=1564162 RepID=A0A543PEB7_9ACTN|nr:hypothetical protein FHU33_1800 [Blastococcus colisei]